MRRFALALGLLAFAPGLISPLAAAERTPQANFVLRCAGCHGMEGHGSEIGGVPSFYHSISTIANDPEGRRYLMHVPGVISASLSDAEIAEVMNWVLGKWGDRPAAPFTVAEVTRLRAEPVPDVVRARQTLAARFEKAGTPIAAYPWP